MNKNLRSFRFFYKLPTSPANTKHYAFVLDFRTDEQANAALASSNRDAKSGEIWTMQECDPHDFDHIRNRARFERMVKRLPKLKSSR